MNNFDLVFGRKFVLFVVLLASQHIFLMMVSRCRKSYYKIDFFGIKLGYFLISDASLIEYSDDKMTLVHNPYKKCKKKSFDAIR